MPFKPTDWLTIQSATWRHSSESTAQINDRPQPSRDIAISKSQLPIDSRQSPLQNNYATTQFRSPQEHFGMASSKIQTATKPSQPVPRSFSPPQSTQKYSSTKGRRTLCRSREERRFDCLGKRNKTRIFKKSNKRSDHASTELSTRLSTPRTTRSSTTPRTTFARGSPQYKHHKSFERDVYWRVLDNGCHQPIPWSASSNQAAHYGANVSSGRLHSTSDGSPR